VQNIGSIPYFDATFDKHGAPVGDVTLPAGITDLFVVSHGWNNNADEAHELYRKLFESFSATGAGAVPGVRSFAVVGVIWPSKKFDELVAVAAESSASGAAGLGGSSAASEAILISKLDRMSGFFTDPSEVKLIDEAKALVPDLEDKGSARDAFVDKIRALLDRSAANREDASDTFFGDSGNELMKRLKVDIDDLGEGLPEPQGAASMALPTSGGAVGTSVQAAGVTEFLSGFKSAAMNVLNFTTYFAMKSRAGTVGSKGVAPLVDRLAGQVDRIHLIGHSFGGRVVTAAAASSQTDKIRSMSLLQAAFDKGRIDGPILVTHTKNDKAVGIAYPLASRINGDTTAAFGDENDIFGGLGRNGAQKMAQTEVSKGALQPVGGTYSFAPGKFFNLEGSAFIKDHGDVHGKEVAQAIRAAIG
jgi:hypothetical protein